MKSCIFCASLSFAVLFSCLPGVSGAGDKKKDAKKEQDLRKKEEELRLERAEQLRSLELLTGNFDARIEYVNFADPDFPTVEVKGTMQRGMVLKDTFLQENLSANFDGKEYRGVGMITYDANKKKFIATWFDTTSPATTQMVGTYDAENKSFTTIGEDMDERGHKWKARDVLRIVSDDEQVFEMYRQPTFAAPEMRVMKITYTRKNLDNKKVDEKKKAEEKKKLDE